MLTILIALCCTHSNKSSGGHDVRLSDLDLSPVITGWKVPGKNVNCEGRPLVLRGKPYATGVGGSPDFMWDIELYGKAIEFQAVVGITDDTNGQGSVQFKVSVDGKIAFDSGVVRANQEIPVKVDLTGAKRLRLIESDGGDGAAFDHGDWCDAIITYSGANIPRSVAPSERIKVRQSDEPVKFSQEVLGDSYPITAKGRPAEFAATVIRELDGQFRLYVSSPGDLRRWRIRSGSPDPLSMEWVYNKLPLRTDPSDVIGTDNSLTSTSRGDLISAHAGTTQRDMTPKPGWWTYNDGKRSVLFVGRMDHGGDWTASGLDAAFAASGEFAWPQAMLNAKGERTVKHFGGWDRPELYSDPFSANVFISMDGDSGSAPEFKSHMRYRGLLFASSDWGKTWRQEPFQEIQRMVPILMTTQPDGRLFLVNGDTRAANCEGNVPQVFWLDPPFVKATGSIHAFATVTPRTGWWTAPFANVSPPLHHHGYDGGISRLLPVDGMPGCRFTFPARENGHSVARVMVCRVDKDGTGIYRLVRTIRATESDGHVLGPVMVEISEPTTAKKSDLALIYWHETFPSKDAIAVKGMLVRGNDEFSEPFFLSTAKGAAHYWKPHPTVWRGDYYRGASFVENGVVNFIAAWPEWRDPDQPIVVNVVKVKVP